MSHPEFSAIMRGTMEMVFHPFFIILCVLMILFFRIILKDSRLMIRIMALCVVLGLGLMTTPWLPSHMIYFLEQQYTPVTQVDPRVHWVVVLGGGVYEQSSLPVNEVLSDTSIKRVLEGVRLYRQLPEATLILSGGSLRDKHQSVGVRMNQLVDWFAIPSEQRIVEFDSINTADEAQYIKKIVGKSSFYLVTSAIHMPRSMRLFQHAGLNPIAAPCGYIYYWKEKARPFLVYIPNQFNMVYTSIAWHEWLGMAWGKLRGIL